MKTLLKFTFLSIVIFASSCSPVYYTPEAHQVSLLEEKGELNATGHLSGESKGIQGAYAVSDKITIAAEYSNVKSENKYGNEVTNTSHNNGKLYGLGIGYNLTKNENWISEAFIRYNRGNLDNEVREYRSTGEIASFPDDRNWGNLTADINKISAQYNIGYKVKYFEFITSLRAGYLNYSNVEGDLMYRDVDHIELLSDNSNYLTFSPALTLRAGFEKVKFQAQLANAYTSTVLSDDINVLNTEKTRLYLGVSVNLQTIGQ